MNKRKPRKPKHGWCTKVKRSVKAAGIGLSALPFIAMQTLAASTTPTTPATTDIWQKATEIMKDVYGEVVAISTIAAIVTASIALLLMNFSKSGRTVDESRAWLKRILITWAIINGLGFIMAYITPFFTGGKWTA